MIVRSLIFLISILGIFAGCLLASLTLVPPSGLSKLIGFGVIATAMIGAWLVFPKIGLARSVWLLLILAILSRVAMLPMAPSTDINRYIWEGGLITEGVNPYLFPADAPERLELRDKWWQGMNHRDKLTAYPPVALIIFGGLAAVSKSVWFFKVVFVVFDLLTLGLVIATLRRHALPIKHAILYALNPLVLFGFAGEAHFDSIFVFFTVLAVFCFERKWYGWVWFAIAMAIHLKIVAVILVPWLFIHSTSRSKVWVLFAGLIVPALPLASGMPNLIKGIKSFGIDSAFNSPLHFVVRWFTGGNVEVASLICYGILAIAILFACYRFNDPMRASRYIFTGFVLCSSIIHYWYLVWALPFVVTSPRIAWFWLWIASGLYFLTSYSVDIGGLWELSPWAYVMQWVPFVLLLLYQDSSHWRALRATTSS